MTARPLPPGKPAETALGGAAVAHLHEQGWETWQEVYHGGMVADIVATSGKVVWVLECKTSLTFQVIAQAHRWVQGGWAHYVSVVVPWVKRLDEGRGLAMRVLEWKGIGALEVKEVPTWPKGAFVHSVTERAPPALHRSARFVGQLRAHLRDAQKKQLAGAAGGGHWTPFRNTCDALRRVVAADPGLTMKDALAKMGEHHYHSDATARSALPVWIEKGKVEGVRIAIEKGKRRLYPVNETPGGTVQGSP